MIATKRASSVCSSLLVLLAACASAPSTSDGDDTKDDEPQPRGGSEGGPTLGASDPSFEAVAEAPEPNTSEGSPTGPARERDAGSGARTELETDLDIELDPNPALPRPTTPAPTTRGPGCELDAPAFCETFDDLASGTGRAGEASGERFSGSRLMPQLPTFDGPFLIGAATTPACRSGLPASIEPPSDFLLCDPNDALPSRHLLVVTAAQNYGQNSLRVRQPFDFAGRTGRVRVDAELWTPSMLYGFVSLAITKEPTGAPSFAIDQNYEGGALPANGVSVQFTNSICAGENSVALTSVIVYANYAQTIVQLTNTPCVSTAPGQLNPVELQLSTESLTVLAGNAGSANDAGLERLATVDVGLPFSRGYVQLNVHNHATLKYSEGDATPRDAWSARFDNLGFDGPVVADHREYEVSDSLQRVEVGDWSGVGVGHYVPVDSRTPLTLSFGDVDPSSMERAFLAFNAWLLPYDLDQPAFLFRVNDGPTQERPLTSSEIGAVTSPVGQGAVSVVLELPSSDLVSGTNRVELWLRDVPNSYPPAIANVDLHLSPADP